MDYSSLCYKINDHVEEVRRTSVHATIVYLYKCLHSDPIFARQLLLIGLSCSPKRWTKSSQHLLRRLNITLPSGHFSADLRSESWHSLLGPTVFRGNFEKFRGEFGKFRGSPRQGRLNSATHRGYTVKFKRLD